MKEVLLASAVIGTGLISYAAWNLFRKDGDAEHEENPNIEVTTLAEVSRNWNKKLSGDVVDLRDLAVIWREQENDKSAPPPPRPVFKHMEIDQFFSDMVEKRRSIKGSRRTIIVKLLKMLDDEGDCPSVVRKNDKESEKKFPEDTFSLLATIPLFRHTLRVARKCAEKVKQEVMLPDIFIVSLAHDIGKVPSYHDRLYSTGDHPLISLVALNKIPEYASLPNRSELDRIVRGHHSIKPKDQLTDLLKHCDQEARREELAALVGHVIDREKTSAKAGMDNPKKPVPLTTAEKPATKNTKSSEDERDHPLGGMEPEEFPDLVKLKIPHWFDADALLTAVKNRINRLDDTARGLRWTAVSTNHGIVYVHPDGLWRAVKEISGNDPTILAADADEGTKRNLLYTFVWELSKVKDAIATNLVAAKYFTTQATVVSGSGKGFTALLVPFNVEVFGVTEASLEESKPSRLRQMVREIKPKQAEFETCVI
jgi:hypothetical protein